MRAHAHCACEGGRSGTKLDIILPSSSSFSFPVLFSQKEFANDFEFLHAFLREGVKKIINYFAGIFHEASEQYFAISKSNVWFFVFGENEMRESTWDLH